MALNKNWVPLHLHTDFSNPSMMEVIDKPETYIEHLSKQGVPAVAFTEHGNIFSWVKKKQLAESAGMKYIHGVEAYITETFENNIRDNYHLILLAKNYDGVKEINRLTSKSYKGYGSGDENRQYYYSPRLSFEQISNTSDNIIITTACLGSPLWQHYKSNNQEALNKWLKFIEKNNHRVWFEVQPHNDPEQKIYNKQLLEWSDEYGVGIVASNDVHALNEESDKLRKILMDSNYDNENEELWLKSYSEMLEAFEIQGVLSKEQAEKALDETHIIASQVEEFTFDLDFKYPQLFENSNQRFLDLIKEGLNKRGYHNLDEETKKIWQERIEKEVGVYQKMKSINYMLLMQYIISEAKANGIYPGYGRGSVSGSLVAYLIGITEVDSIKEDLSFERFMNPARITLSDIDVDWMSEDREWVTNFMFNNDKFETAAIVTFSTLGTRGAIKDIGKALGYDFSVTNAMTARVLTVDGKDVIPQNLKEDYPDIIELVERVVGTITHVGRHAGGFLVTDRSIVNEIGTIEVKTSEYPVTTIAMSEVEGLFYVKLDMLGVDNVGLINRTAVLAGIERPTPTSDFIDFDDKDVIESMRKDTTGIFQFVEDRANKALTSMFSDKSNANILEAGFPIRDAVTRLSLLSAGLRPGAKDLFPDITMGRPHDNGIPELNKMLNDTMGMMVYQEDVINFLINFCDQTPSEADVIRRAIGKKKRDVMEREVPLMKEIFIKNAITKYGLEKDEAERIADESFQNIYNASDYSFSKNHAVAYSYIGYISAWLRHYYPLEFLTTAFNIWQGSLPKVGEFTRYAESVGIDIRRPRFRYSKSDYFFDKELNAIYEGTTAIKDVSKKAGDLLFTLRDRDINSLVDLAIHIKDDTYFIIDGKKHHLIEIMRDWTEEDIKELDKRLARQRKGEEEDIEIVSSSIPVNIKSMLALIRLGYFEEFGGPIKLENVYTRIDKIYKADNLQVATKAKKYKSLIDIEKHTKERQLSLYDQAQYELYYLGRILVSDKDVSPSYAFVTSIIKERKSYTLAAIHSVKKGLTTEIKVSGRLYRTVPFIEGDLIEILETSVKPKPVYENGKMKSHPTDKELWIEDCRYIRKGKAVKKGGKK